MTWPTRQNPDRMSLAYSTLDIHRAYLLVVLLCTKLGRHTQTAFQTFDLATNKRLHKLWHKVSSATITTMSPVAFPFLFERDYNPYVQGDTVEINEGLAKEAGKKLLATKTTESIEKITQSSLWSPWPIHEMT